MAVISPNHKAKHITLAEVVNSNIFAQVVIGLILLNSIMIGMETYPALYTHYETLFIWGEKIFLWIFSVEIILRIITTPKGTSFFRDGWNVFDFIIVASGHIFIGTHFVSILRILRVLRVLRTISAIPSLQRLVEALLRTIPSLGNIIVLMSITFYVFGIMGTILFAHVSPEFFGSLHRSLLTLFQVVTLESWASGVLAPIMEEAPWAWVYFVSFILVGTFIIFNLFIGVIVNNVQQTETDSQEKGKTIEDLSLEIKELKNLVLELKNKN